MKKKLTAVFLALVTAVTTVYANDIELIFEIGSFNAKLNGSEIYSYSYLSDKGNTMVEIRTVSETLGCTVKWHPETREVGISDDGLTMQLKIDSDEAVVNGSTVKMAEAAVIRNDKTLVPIRFVSESFGSEVGYEHETKTVTVSSKSYDGRVKQLKESEAELMTSYYNAVKSWLMVTDTEISAESFSNVWDSLVNTKVMELLPGRAVDAEICEKYRAAAKMSFSDRYILSSSDGYMMITSRDRQVSFVYNPKERTITLDGKLPPVIRRGGGSSGIKPNPTEEPSVSPTVQPTETDMPQETVSPTAQPEPLPPDVVTPHPTKKPGGGDWNGTNTPDYEPTDEPLIESTPTVQPDKTNIPSETKEPEPHNTPSATKEPEPHNTPSVTKEPLPEETNEPTVTPTDETDIDSRTSEPEAPDKAPQETEVSEVTDTSQSTEEPLNKDSIAAIKPVSVSRMYMKYHRLSFKR
ncbi:MAG: stalk domain-containing protein [bacterium]|nr:stalk domain-containing protein [bacterium]